MKHNLPLTKLGQRFLMAGIASGNIPTKCREWAENPGVALIFGMAVKAGRKIGEKEQSTKEGLGLFAPSLLDHPEMSVHTLTSDRTLRDRFADLEVR